MRALFFVLVLCGCATPLHERFFTQVTEGEPAWQVEKDFGVPASFQDSKTVPGGTTWVYVAHGESCGVVIKDKAVVKKACDTRHRVSAGQAILKGLSDMSMAGSNAVPSPAPAQQPATQPTTTCTTETVPLTGGMVTNCH